jgi:hypothetical protein
MRASEAAVAEYALTETPEQGDPRIIVPISDDRRITLVRTSAIRTDKGVVWWGRVADTGETAILQWWNDGRLTGQFGYRGHIYTVMNMGDDLHAVLEVDPRMLPPDHPRVTSADVHRTDAPVWPRAEPAAPPALPKVEAIMSYAESGCLRIPYWSNPHVVVRRIGSGIRVRCRIFDVELSRLE